ncbi:hypothetical protein niasHS_014946 [Heterodera schachtii]|uniref:Uncharacterized protein n=1 Tax=Heterodera schachtii TaxID=97005 RepID=A0ABD2I4T9_HETSC
MSLLFRARPFSPLIVLSFLLFFSLFLSATAKIPTNVENSRRDLLNSVIDPHVMEKRFTDCFSTCGRLREPNKKICFKNCLKG